MTTSSWRRPRLPISSWQVRCRRGGKPAIIDGATGRVLSYAELATSVRRAAAGLTARGVAKGDVLALCSSQLPRVRGRLLCRRDRRGGRDHHQPAGAPR